MDIESMIHNMIWMVVDGLAAITVIASLYHLFFNGGFAKIITLFGNGLWA